jgi:ParB-like chromosome segregation protein Spo0J
MQIALADLRLDGGTQPRQAIDYTLVSDYADHLRAGAIFPSVVAFYDGSDYWLADGFHRVKAAREAGLSAIDAAVEQGTREDAVWFSCGANQSHGLRRQHTDKRRAVVTALRHPKSAGLSDRAIAEHCGVSRELVGEVRRELAPPSLSESDKRTGVDGHKRGVHSEQRSKAGKASADARKKRKQAEQAPAAKVGPEQVAEPEAPLPVDFLRDAMTPPEREPEPEPAPESPPLGTPYQAALAAVRALSLVELEAIREQIDEAIRLRRTEAA